MTRHRCQMLCLFLCLCFLSVGCTPHEKYSQAELDALAKCLPPNVTLNTPMRSSTGGKATLKDTLAHLGAYCKEGKIYGSEGKEIYFYFPPLMGPYTSPAPVRPKDFDQITAKDREKINELESHYRVIVMTPIGPFQ